MMLFSTLPLYFARTFLTWFGTITFGLTVIILMFDFSELLRRSSSKENIPVDVIIQMALCKLPHLLEILLPFIVLFATMFALWRLNRQNEISVSKAAGLSVWQLLSPFMATAFLIGAFDLFVFNPLSSEALSQFNLMNREVLQNKSGGIAISKTGIWLRYAAETGPIMIRVEQISAPEKSLKHMTILEYNHNDELKVRIESERAYFVDENGLDLHNVWVYPFGGSPQYHDVLPYRTALSLSHIQDNKREPETISFWELPSFIELLEDSGLSSVRYRLYLQSIIARAIWLVAMVLLAAMAALRPIRQGKQFLFILPTTLIGFSLYFLHDITYAMGQSSTLPIALAAWSPIMISAMIGLVTLLHLEEH